jgi:hypothetical protein
MASSTVEAVAPANCPSPVFDFLTWFEFAPADERRFDELIAMLRATEEWTFIDREVDIRVER